MTIPLSIRSLIFAIVVPGTAAVLIPYVLAHSRIDARIMWGKAPAFPFTELLGYLLILIGISIYLRCVYDFTSVGKGTPAIYDPPRKLVVSGLYKYVRNPMYVGIITLIVGQVLLYGSPTVLLYAIAMTVNFTFFVMWYEEPSLRKTFGQEYIDYTERVKRWMPATKRKSK